MQILGGPHHLSLIIHQHNAPLNQPLTLHIQSVYFHKADIFIL